MRSIRRLSGGGRQLVAFAAAGSLGAVMLPATLASTAAAQPQPVAPAEGSTSYVAALGDSYMSGEGGVRSNRGFKDGSVDETGSMSGFLESRYWATGAPATEGSDGNTKGFYSGFVYGDAGGYQTKNDAETLPLCHKSAWMPAIGLSVDGVDLGTANLACSGATTGSAARSASEVAGVRGAEPSAADPVVKRPGVDFADLGDGVVGQAAQLQQFAAANDVKVVTLSIGGNDAGFATIATACITNYLKGSRGDANPPCQDDPAIAPLVTPEALGEVKAKIKGAIANVVKAMDDAGKAPGSWRLVYAAPPLPVTPSTQNAFNPADGTFNLNAFASRNAGNCPVANSDLDWLTSTVYPGLVGAMKMAMVESKATLEGVPSVFVDTTSAFDGHRLCEKGAADTLFDYPGGVAPEEASPGDSATVALWGPGNGLNTEWVTDAPVLDQTGSDPHLKQNPLHPNYWGQRAMSACYDAVLASGEGNAVMTCSQVRDANGNTLDAKNRPAMTAATVEELWPAVPSVLVPLPEALRLADKVAFAGPETKTFNRSALGEAIPDNATALALNITVANTTTPGHAQIFPGYLADEPAFPTSVLNWETGERLANGVSVKIAADGSFKVRLSEGTADVFIDVTGYYRDEVPNGVQVANGEPTGTFAGLPTPQRVFDQTVAAQASVPVDLTTSLAGDPVIADPSKVLGVVVNITASNPAGSGHFRVQPSSQEQLTPTSVLNWTGSQDVVANSLIVTPGPDGQVKLFNGSGGSVRALVDVTGVFVNDGSGAAFYPVDPQRITDTREGGGPLASGAFLAVATTTEQVPAEATGIAFNLTEDGGTSRGHLRAQTEPGPTLTSTSIINWPGSDHTRANASMLRKNPDNGGLHVYNGSATDIQVIVDLLGYFAPSAKASDTARFPIG